MPVEGPHADIREQQRKKLAEIFTKNKVKSNLTERGPQFVNLLRTFEDRMERGETVVSFNFGSNSPDELKQLFIENRINPDFGFGGLAELENIELAYGSRSQKRGCPVATLKEAQGAKVIGYFALVTKEQFELIAKRECGDTMGRDPTKGRYRRAVIYLNDPRDPAKEIQAVTFVLNERHSEFDPSKVGIAASIRNRIQGSPEEPRFEEYAGLVTKQQEQTQGSQKRDFFGAPPLPARWHSRGHR